jgi:hypothetical protein
MKSGGGSNISPNGGGAGAGGGVGPPVKGDNKTLISGTTGPVHKS